MGNEEDPAGAARQELEKRGLPFDAVGFIAAVEAGDLEAVRAYLTAGMSPVAPGPAGSVLPLEAAVRRGEHEIVKLLLAAGAPPDSLAQDGRRVLALAVDAGRPEIVTALLDGGAAVDAAGDDGVTALHQAAQRGDVAICEALLAAGADLEACTVDGSTPLIEAVRSGGIRTVRLLVERRADLNATTADGATALEVARSSRQADVFRYLKQEGARAKEPSFERPGAIAPVAEGIVEGGRRALPWLLAAGAVFLILTTLNLAGVNPLGPRLPDSLDLPDAEVAQRTLELCVGEIDAFAAQYGKVPADLAAVDLDDIEGARYQPAADGRRYQLVVTVGKASASHQGEAPTGGGS